MVRVLKQRLLGVSTPMEFSGYKAKSGRTGRARKKAKRAARPKAEFDRLTISDIGEVLERMQRAQLVPRLLREAGPRGEVKCL